MPPSSLLLRARRRSERLTNFVQKAAQATLVARCLRRRRDRPEVCELFPRAMNCGAITEDERV
jgi:hypothetical protein